MNEQSEQTLVELMRYNNWANGLVLEACERLDAGQLAMPIAGAFGTVAETLAHIIRAETRYIELLTGTRPQPPFAWQDGPSVAQLKAFAREVGEKLVETAARVPPSGQVADEWDGEVHHYAAMPIYIQIVNHGVEHRTNITTVLNQEGLAPPEVDGWGYLMAHWERFAEE